jgi:pyruvate/2-oxoglutarate dehydrogenase complex dihydrolipoamide dehydrogenase (E3) component
MRILTAHELGATAMRHFQHTILGTGQATGTLLGDLMPTGDSIAVIEGDRVGGTCVNTGCTPTKALVASAKVAHIVRRAPEFGVQAKEVEIDFKAVRARMNRIRDNTGMVSWITSAESVSLIEEWGRFEGPRQIRVGDEVITSDQIYINAGARARVPEIPGLETVPWLDQGRLLELTEVPEHLIILGGSYIALEFSQIFRRFGARVTVLERGPQLVFREDADVAESIKEILELEGIEFCLDSSVVRVAPDGADVTVTIAQGGEERLITGSHFLVAVGRVPNSDGLNVEAAGIELDEKGFIQVDDYCRTSAEGVFAVGDINGHGAFTHTSANDAEIVLDLTRGGTRKLSDRIPVYGLFIDPALGRVGMTEKEAVAKGHSVSKATRPMSQIGRAKEMGETLGFAKLLVDADTDQILGAAILGPGGDEIINMLAAYMYSGLPCKEYRKSVLVHPTISELIPWILDTLEPV